MIDYAIVEPEQISVTKIVLPAETITYDVEKKILHSLVAHNAEITLKNARAAIQACKKLTAGRPTPILVNLTQIKSITREARLYYGSDTAGQTLAAVALLANSPIGNIVGKFLTGINNMSQPVKFFTDIDNAYQWLMTFQS